MAVSLVQMVLFFVTILAGFLSAYFTYSIYRKTKGGSSGWMHIAIVGILLGIFSVVATVNQLAGVNSSESLYKPLIDIVVYIGLALIFPISIAMLAKDMKVATGFFTPKLIAAYYVIIFGVMTVYYLLLTTPISFLGELLSISVSMILLTSPIFIYLTYRMSRETKSLPWKLLLIGAIFMFSASLMEQVSSGACGGWQYNQVLSGQSQPGSIGIPECASFQSDIMFATTIPLGGAANPLVGVIGTNDVFWLLASLFDLAAFALLWRSMR